MKREYRNRFSPERANIVFRYNGEEYLLEPLTEQQSYILECFSEQPDKIYANREKFSVDIGLNENSVRFAITKIMEKWITPILGEEKTNRQYTRLQFAVEMYRQINKDRVKVYKQAVNEK